MEDKDKTIQLRNAFLCVVLTAVACIAVGILLIFSTMNEQRVNVFENEKLEQAKTQLRENPDDETLQWTVRELDRQYRQGYIYSRELTERARYLLVVFLLAFIISSRVYINIRVEPEVPDPNDCKCQAEQSRIYTSWGMLGVVAIFFIGSLVFIVSSMIPERSEESNEIAVESQENSDTEVNSADVQFASIDELKQNWHRFRGFEGSGIANYSNFPLEIEPASGKNILWKFEPELPGFNSVIIYGDRFFYAGANEINRKVYCHNLEDGKLIWSSNIKVSGDNADIVPDVMDDTGLAACTMATDGFRVYSIFANGDLACHDFEGKEIWAKNLGIPESSYGFAASLDVWQDNVLVQFDSGFDAEEPLARMLSIDGTTGKVEWELARPVLNSWTSPIVAYTGGKWQCITVSAPWAISYDPATGRELWRFGELHGDTAPSPVVYNDMTFIQIPYESITAVKTNLDGNVSESGIVWQGSDGIPDATTPVIYNGKIWLLESYGTLTCYNIEDGSVIYSGSIDGEYYSSPTLVGDKIICFSLAENGKYSVLGTGDTFELIYESEFGERIGTSPAFAEGKMIIRGVSNIYCIGEK